MVEAGFHSEALRMVADGSADGAAIDSQVLAATDGCGVRAAYETTSGTNFGRCPAAVNPFGWAFSVPSFVP
jgi:hypothetical protein